MFPILAISVLAVISYIFMIIFFMQGNLKLMIVYGIIAILSTLLSGYLRSRRKSTLIQQLWDVDKQGFFSRQRQELLEAKYVADSKSEFFEGSCEEDDSVMQTYTLICERIESNIKSALRFIGQYDYINYPSYSYLDRLEKDSRDMVHRLNDLSELVLQIEDSASDVDITFADSMLESLKEVLNSEEE